MTPAKKIFFFVLAAVLLPLGVYLRICTYATGADPQIFISLAQDILAGRFASVAAFVVPGWPLFLAAVIRLFGPFAAYAANVPLFALLLLVLWLLLSDLLASRSRAALASLFSALALLAGYSLNPHFLLWAFRQTPIYLTSLLSLLFIRRASRAQFAARRAAAFAWLVASLAAALASTVVRETSALVLPVLFLHLLLDSGAPPGSPLPPPPFRRRLPLVIAFVSLNLAALAAAVAAVLLLRLNVFNSQNLYILRSLVPLLRDHLLSPAHMARALSLVLGEFPWLLGLCLAVGVAAAVLRRRFRPFATLFLAPAVLHFLFEAFHKIHMRFFLTPVFFLAPLAALGALLLWDAAAPRIFRRFGPAAPRLAALSPAALLAVWAAFVILSVQPWGPRVDRAQVRECLRAVDSAAPGPDTPVLLDPKSRYLREVLHIFSPRRIVDVTPESIAELDLSSPAIFLRPMDDDAFHPAVIALNATQLLEFHADLSPVPAPGGGPAHFFIGPSLHRIVRVSPPASASATIPLPDLPPNLLSTAFPSVFLRVGAPPCAATNPVSASLLLPSAPDAPLLLSSALLPGFNDLPVPVSALADALASGAPPALRLSAPAPFPRSLPVAWNDPDRLHWEFGLFMFPPHPVLSPEFHEFDDLRQPDPPFPTWPVVPRVREFSRPGFVFLPAGFDGSAPGSPPVPALYFLDLTLSALHDTSASIPVSVSFPDAPSVPSASASIPASHKASRVSFAWPSSVFPSNALPPRFRLSAPADPQVLRLYPDNRRSASSRIHSMDLWRVPLAPDVHIRFGNPDDDPLLLSGFHARENLSSPERGRWMDASAEILLPVAPATFSFSFEFDASLLPDPLRSALPASLSVSLDGSPLPLSFSPVPGSPFRFLASALIPPSAFSDPFGVHRLRLSAPAFSPADSGHSDSRSLSLFARSLSLSPAP